MLDGWEVCSYTVHSLSLPWHTLWSRGDPQKCPSKAGCGFCDLRDTSRPRRDFLIVTMPFSVSLWDAGAHDTCQLLIFYITSNTEVCPPSLYKWTFQGISQKQATLGGVISMRIKCHLLIGITQCYKHLLCISCFINKGQSGCLDIIYSCNLNMTCLGNRKNVVLSRCHNFNDMTNGTSFVGITRCFMSRWGGGDLEKFS
jgi:hypothetical protein